MAVLEEPGAALEEQNAPGGVELSSLNPAAPEFIPESRPRANEASSSDDGATSEASEASGSGCAPPGFREVRGQLRPTEPNHWISPLDVHFSQMRARERFRCDRLIEDSVPDVRAVLLSAEDAAAIASEPSEAEAELTEGVATGKVWRLEAPFPPIEVLMWRCKLRDEKTGRPKVDPETGGELCDVQDRCFSLDNRRLFCLQRAAAAVWPDRAVVAVIELPPGPLARSRELRKFRTLDCGRSVFIGSRGEGEELVRWSWRVAVGLESSAQDARGDPAEVSVLPRRRKPPPRRGNPPVNQRREAEEEEDRTQGLSALSPGVSLVVFIIIYLTLRFGSKYLREGPGDTGAAVADNRSAVERLREVGEALGISWLADLAPSTLGAVRCALAILLALLGASASRFI